MTRRDSFARRDVLLHVPVFSFVTELMGRAEARPSETDKTMEREVYSC
jgi:hypothetical protein